MDKGLLPRRYAKALYKFAAGKNATERVYNLMRNIAEAFDSNDDLQTVIANPFVPVGEKTSLIATAAGSDDSILSDFVKLMVQNNRIDIIRQTALEYIALYRRQNNIFHVNIVSAAQLNEADRKRLTDMIEQHLDGASAEYSFDIDPDLIGGFVVSIDNERLDASVRNELKQLRFNLIK